MTDSISIYLATHFIDPFIHLFTFMCIAENVQPLDSKATFNLPAIVGMYSGITRD